MLDELDQTLVDKYFMNFSVFESIPDVWAIDQVFPIVPLTRLDERPTAARRARRPDLRLRRPHRSVRRRRRPRRQPAAARAASKGETYRLGIFLIGAYQETLGDIHNLFGDTDAVNVRLTDGGGYTLSHLKRGDTTDVMLDYVGYDLAALRRAYRDKIEAASLDAETAAALHAALERGLTGYTYLEESPHGE